VTVRAVCGECSRPLRKNDAILICIHHHRRRRRHHLCNGLSRETATAYLSAPVADDDVTSPLHGGGTR